MNSFKVCLLFLCFICCFFNGKHVLVKAATTTTTNSATTKTTGGTATGSTVTITTSVIGTTGAPAVSRTVNVSRSSTTKAPQTTGSVHSSEQITTVPSPITCYYYTCQNDSCFDDSINSNSTMQTCNSTDGCFVMRYITSYNNSSMVNITAGCVKNCTESEHAENKTSCCKTSNCNTGSFLRRTTTIKTTTTLDYSGSYTITANALSVIAAFVLLVFS